MRLGSVAALTAGATLAIGMTALPAAARPAAPAHRAHVAAHVSPGGISGQLTGPGGSYSITGLAPGSYTVQFSSGCGTTGLATQWWNGATSATGATPVAVKAGAIATGIDAAMTSLRRQR